MVIKGIVLSAWFIAFILLIDCSFTLISAPDTLWNILGLFILAITITVSIETKCLTKFIKKK